MKKYCPQCGEKYHDGQPRFCLKDGVLLSLPDPYRLVGGVLEGRYRIEALVGVGGFGAVYSAQQLGTGRAVAFKILKPDVALQVPEAVELFESEAKTAASFTHESIVTIYDAGRTGEGLSYIAMEWLEGRPLDEELKAKGRFSVERTAELLRPVAAALAHAHTRYVVHRDLKPGNVMLANLRERGEQVKVVDFGIAKVLSSTAGSLISRSIGTPQYAAPEQMKYGARVDGRADIYALGVMLYQMLTGCLPFDVPRVSDANAQIRELLRLKREAALPSLRVMLPEASVALEELLLRMMAHDPQQRPSQIGEIPALFEAAYRSVTLAQAPTVIDEIEQVGVTEMRRNAEQTRPRPIRERQTDFNSPEYELAIGQAKQKALRERESLPKSAKEVADVKMCFKHIACPNCGHVMQANALEKAGTVATPCLACQESVYVETNERGKVEDIYVGERGAGFADALLIEEDDEEFKPSRRATIVPLVLGTLGVLFIAWVASSLYCTRPGQRESLMQEPTPTGTSAIASSAKPKPTPANTLVLTFDSLSGVTFPVDKAELNEESRLAFREAVEALKALPKGSIVEIGGHTDNQGGEERNKQLSLQRAEAVRQYLLKQNIAAELLKVKGYGATQPVTSNETELGKAQNRRIEFRIVKKAN